MTAERLELLQQGTGLVAAWLQLDGFIQPIGCIQPHAFKPKAT